MWHFHKWVIMDVNQAALTPGGKVVGYHTVIKKRCKRCGKSKTENEVDSSPFDAFKRLKLELAPEIQAKLEAHWDSVARNL